MLKPDGQSEPKPRRFRRRWALLMLTPGGVLLVWALVGMRVEWGDRYIQTRREWSPTPAAAPHFDSTDLDWRWIFGITEHRIVVGHWTYAVEYRLDLNDRKPVGPATKAGSGKEE